MARSRRVAFVPLLVALMGAALVGPRSVLAATPAPPPALVPAVTSGPPGLPVGISGTDFEAGTTYGLCLQPSSATGNCGYDGSNLGSFTADAGGQPPVGTQVSIPNVLAGTFELLATAPGTAAPVAAATFDVTAPTLSLGTNAGPGALVVSASGIGFAPAVAYTLCIVPTGTPECGGVGIPLGDVTTDASGDLPPGTTVRIPGQLPATYDVGAMLKGGSIPNLIATVPFVEVAPTMAVNPASGPGGTQATVTGAGLAPGGKYDICLVAAAATQCGGAGIDLATFAADDSGAVPDGVTVTVPIGTPGDALVGLVVAGDTPFLIGSAPFSLTAGTPPPRSSGGSPPTAAAIAGSSAPDGSASSTSASSDQGPLGSMLLILVAIAIVVVIALGLILSRRRQAGTRR